MEKTISELPDEILHRILSFLPIEIVFQSCCPLSRRWKIICYTLPRIDLSKLFMNTPGEYPSDILNFVDRYLFMREKNEYINIDSFKLNLPGCDSRLTSHLNAWFQTLSRCNIGEIFFSISFLNRFHGYNFPEEILSSESLTNLEITGCKFEVSENYVNIKLVSLKLLSLSHVVISDKSVERLIKSCVSLNYLRIKDCDGFSSLKVEGLLGLWQLFLTENRNLKRVEIDEPSLLYLGYAGGYIKHNDIKFSNCINLKKLCLKDAGITGEQLSEQLLPLENLKDLVINSCPEITSLNITTGSLERLRIEHHEELSVANIIAPRLQSLCLASRYVSPSTKMVSLSLVTSPMLIVKYLFIPKVVGATMFIDLLKFLGTFDGSQLTLATSIPNSTIPQRWSKNFLHVKSLARFQKFWADPEARLYDVLRSNDRITAFSFLKRSTVKILTDQPIEIYDEED